MKFDVHRAGMIGGAALGQFLVTIEAVDHRAAKTAATKLHRSAAAAIWFTYDADRSASGPLRSLG
jgi:hypothetical protein